MAVIPPHIIQTRSDQFLLHRKPRIFEDGTALGAYKIKLVYYNYKFAMARIACDGILLKTHHTTFQSNELRGRNTTTR